jgi:hypothetical protein
MELKSAYGPVRCEVGAAFRSTTGWIFCPYFDWEIGSTGNGR